VGRRDAFQQLTKKRILVKGKREIRKKGRLSREDVRKGGTQASQARLRGEEKPVKKGSSSSYAGKAVPFHEEGGESSQGGKQIGQVKKGSSKDRRKGKKKGYFAQEGKKKEKTHPGDTEGVC